MTALKWQRIADSDGTTIMYTAVAGRPEPRQPYCSYRIYRHHSHIYDYYTVSLWHPNPSAKQIELAWPNYGWCASLAAAKRAAQDHYTATLTNV